MSPIFGPKQFWQLIDSFLLAIALFVAHTLRYFNTKEAIDPFANYYWLIIVVMLFGPILLDLHHFYDVSLDKPKSKTLRQIVPAMIYLIFIAAFCVIFLRLRLANRSVPLLFVLVATIMLLIKDQMIHRARRV